MLALHEADQLRRVGQADFFEQDSRHAGAAARRDEELDLGHFAVPFIGFNSLHR